MTDAEFRQKYEAFEKKTETTTAQPAQKEEVTTAQPAADTSVKQVSPTITTPGQEWDDMDMEQQREIAFKIVYFFIAFVFMTFGLLYLYYKIDQKEQEKEERNKRAKGIFYGDVNQKTFFDFLAGQVDDENYSVNPNARKSLVSSAPLTKEEDKDETDVVPSLKASAVYYQ